MKSFMNAFLAVGLVLFSNRASAEAISAVKAAELACHRLDRLVVLKKIDKTFASQFHRLELSELAANDPSGAKYEVTAFQTAPHHGSPMSVIISIDASGKVIKHQLGADGNPGQPVVWTGKDPVSLVESGLHYVLDEYPNKSQLRPFAIDFQSLTLNQTSTANGSVAEIAMKAKSTTAKLILTLDPNGKLLNSQVIP